MFAGIVHFFEYTFDFSVCAASNFQSSIREITEKLEKASSSVGLTMELSEDGGLPHDVLDESREFLDSVAQEVLSCRLERVRACMCCIEVLALHAGQHNITLHQPLH